MSNFSFATELKKKNKKKKNQKQKNNLQNYSEICPKKKNRHFSYSSFSPPPLKLQRHNP